ncbi:MAG: toxin [Anaerolineae bacterium]|nr:toxin [Anaerolineae bacterium]
MKVYTWNDAKNEILQSARQISFEDIILYIEKGYLLDVLEHPNQEKYPGQKVFVVHVDQYAYLVPFVEDENTIFLKTIIPSRKATSLYMKGK